MGLKNSVSDQNKELLGSSLIEILYSVTDVIHVRSINTILILINNAGNTK